MPRCLLRPVSLALDPTTMLLMPQTEHVADLRLQLPEHVLHELDGWSQSELGRTAQEAVEDLLEELCVNGQLRLAVPEQLGPYSEDV